MAARRIPRPVRVDPPLSRAPFIDPKTGVLSPHGLRVLSFLRDRSGGDNDDVWAALGIGFTGLTQVNMVGQQVASIESAVAAVQGAVAGLRGEINSSDATEALALAVTALVQVQARASGITDLRLGQLDRLVSSLGARLAKAQQAQQMQINDQQFEVSQSEVVRVAGLQYIAAKTLDIGETLNELIATFAVRVRSLIFASAPVEFDSSNGFISLNDSLTSLGTLTTAADKSYYTTALDTWAAYDLTTFGRSVSALADASAGRTLFGLGSLAVLSSINDSNWSGTDLAVANGGTGASTASAARTNLGVAIGSDVQAYSANLDEYAAVNPTTAGLALLDDADASAQRTTLGLGSLATLSSVNNSNWSGTVLSVANGGTGSASASAARTALGLVIGSDVAAYFAPQAGWTAATGTATRTTFDTATVTLPDLAQRVKALIDDLTASQTIGA